MKRVIPSKHIALTGRNNKYAILYMYLILYNYYTVKRSFFCSNISLNEG